MKLSRTVKWILVAAVVWMLLLPTVVLAPTESLPRPRPRRSRRSCCAARSA